MRQGFTGTREGWTEAQRAAVLAYLTANWPSELHVGCCVGCDEQVAELVSALNADAEQFCRSPCRIVGHPPADRKHLSERCAGLCDEVRAHAPGRVHPGAV